MLAYEILLTLHVIAAVLWVGGGSAIALMAMRLQRSGEQMAAYAKNVEWFGKVFFTPFSLLTLVSGALLVREMDSVTLGDFFVQYGLTAIVATIAIGAGYLSPQSGKLAKVIGTGGAESPEAQALLSRILLVAGLDSLMLLSVVAVMSFKPF